MEEIKFMTTYKSDELKEIISSAVHSALKVEVNRILDSPKIPAKPYLTRQEAAKELNVSLPTLNAWEKAHILIPVRIGTRVRYRFEDISNAFHKTKNKAL